MPLQVVIGVCCRATTCLVDGHVTQKANTSELLFDVATALAHVSTVVTPRPGDLITTGPAHFRSELIAWGRPGAVRDESSPDHGTQTVVKDRRTIRSPGTRSAGSSRSRATRPARPVPPGHAPAKPWRGGTRRQG
ncbi:fumarylacetoacetate hydrolase family protein [Streptomyces sp. NPDC047880]|uniref:fumarylacetoacetate hydrolase family protein n=1 Tax=Streptomyces sp. NPDC047880 TaxID=3155626 RepID=UPI0034526441